MILKKISFIFLFITTICAQAQPPKSTTGSSFKGTIKGRITDSGTKQNMEYANVAAYKTTDSTLVTGGITNGNGEFEIGPFNTGSYYLDANFIGFNKIRIKNITINPERNVVDLGTIELHPSNQEIGTVEVVAERSRVEYKVDKKVINVGQDINAAGGTVADVLENTPSVQVDIEGNVTLRGSSNFTVLIDGKPSTLSGSDALQQIPASVIENIEIITNPSVKYDPDGMAGIVNLVMKKNILSGFNGIVNASIGSNDKKGVSLTINQKTKKRNLSFGFDMNDRPFSGENKSSRQTFQNDTIFYLNKEGTRGFNHGGYSFKAGSDFYLSNFSTLGFSAQLGHYSFESGGHGNIHKYTSPITEDIYSQEQDPSKRDGNYVNGNMNFQHKFNENGTHKLDVVFYYSHRKGSDLDVEDELYTNSSFEPTGLYLSRINTNENDASNEYRFKADYTKPLGETGKLEAGIQSRIDREKEDYLFERYDTAAEEWINNEKYSSSMDFKREIHSAYTTVSSKIGPIEYMLGVRGEYTNREIDHAKVDKPYILNRFDFFPSGHFSYTLFDESQLMASYSRRINRPNGRDLDPFESYRDQYTIRVGNPALKPEYTNSYEVSYVKHVGKSFVSLESFYRITNDAISHLNELRDDNILYETTVNLNNDYSLGGELMGNISFAEWLLLNTSVSVYQYKIESDSNEGYITRESTNINGRFNSTFKFSPASRMQLTGTYQGPSVSAQGETKGMFYTNVSYRQDFWSKKLTATLSVQDILGTATRKGSSNGTNFISTYSFKREPRVLMLTLSYKINNYKMDESASDNNEMNFNEGSF